ncbi:MAG TPA: metal-dependent hydrolase [Thermoanaerobaculia bacterium]|nr:metal-dependent hydrolase [Thermoanaerobaculia bacterium]
MAHTLLGATLGHLAARGAPRADDEPRERGIVLAGIVAANVPDVDALAYLAGSDFALGFRRGITHGVVAMALWPLLLVALCAWWRSRGSGRSLLAQVTPRLLLVVALGCWSHPLLDWLNTYGIRLLMPFDQRWFYGDVAFIVDPWMWLLLGGGLVLARSPGVRERRRWLVLALICAGAVAASPTPIGARLAWLVALLGVGLGVRSGGGARGRWPVAVALALFVLYVGALTIVEREARRRVADIAALGSSPHVISAARLMVGPRPLDPMTWQVVVRLRDRYRIGSYRLGASGVRWQDPLPHGPGGPAVEGAWEDPAVAGFARWVRFPYHRIVEEPEARFVYLLDARYATEPTTGFGGARIPAEGLGDREPPP